VGTEQKYEIYDEDRPCESVGGFFIDWHFLAVHILVLAVSIKDNTVYRGRISHLILKTDFLANTLSIHT
jgi:hypothetical protein